MDSEFVILLSGKLPALKEKLTALDAAGISGQIVQPPDAGNGG